MKTTLYDMDITRQCRLLCDFKVKKICYSEIKKVGESHSRFWSVFGHYDD